jgi:hypothetical protein
MILPFHHLDKEFIPQNSVKNKILSPLSETNPLWQNTQAANFRHQNFEKARDP